MVKTSTTSTFNQERVNKTTSYSIQQSNQIFLELEWKNFRKNVSKANKQAKASKVVKIIQQITQRNITNFEKSNDENALPTLFQQLKQFA